MKTSRSDNTVTATSFDAGQPPVTDKNAGHKKPRSQNPGEKTIHWYPTPDADLYRALIAPYQPYLEKLQDAGANPQELLNTYDQYRILCAGHHGALGTRRINAALRQLHQRAQGADTSLAYYHGLPLMILENDHRQQLYNGDTGICLEDDNGLQLHLPGHEVRLSDSEEQLRARLWPLLEAGRYDPPWVRDLARELRRPTHKDVKATHVEHARV